MVSPMTAITESETNTGGSLTSLWERPGYLIRRLHQIHVAIFLDECAEYGITPVQYAVMTALLVHDLQSPRSAAQPKARLVSPIVLFAENAVHGKNRPI